MRESVFETLVGGLVILVAGIFLWFALAVGGDGEVKGDQYSVLARFNNVSGISRGSDVRIAGVKAGVAGAAGHRGISRTRRSSGHSARKGNFRTIRTRAFRPMAFWAGPILRWSRAADLTRLPRMAPAKSCIRAAALTC